MLARTGVCALQGGGTLVGLVSALRVVHVPTARRPGHNRVIINYSVFSLLIAQKITNVFLINKWSITTVH